MKPEVAASVRASISFPQDIYEPLGQLAKQKNVSMARVVRDVVERYVAEQQANSEQE